MIEGSMADWRFRVFYDAGQGEDDGECSYNTHKMQAEILLHPDLGAIAHLNTLLHELGHLIKVSYKTDLSHRDIYNIAAAYTQALVSAGLVDPIKLEAHMRTHVETKEKTP